MGRYERRRTVGRGASGTVYEVCDTWNGEVRAMKVYHPEAGLPKDETRFACKVTHPNVCRVYDCFMDDDGYACVTMEYVDGGNLRDRIHAGPLSEKTCESLFLQILDALEAIHEAGIVHRDLKPRNVLLTQGGQVKIGDFGHACRIGTQTDVVATGVIGTPPYAAPEQTMTGRTCDARTDIYAAGILLVAMLTGNLFDDCPADVPIPSDLPKRLEDVILGSVGLEPSQRFSSVAEVRRALGGESQPSQSQATPPKRRATPILVVAASALLIASLGVFLWGRNNLRTDLPKSSLAGSAAIPNAPAALEKTPDPIVALKRPVQRFAVLDFTNSTGNPALDRYSVGIPETIRSELAHIRALTLVDATGVYEGSPRDIARSVGADAVVTGTITWAGKDLRLVAEIVEVDSRDVLGTVAAAGPAKNLFKLQADLTQKLADVVRSKITAAERQDFEAGMASGRSPQAFRAFSSGLYFLHENMPADALKSFDSAVAIDPMYSEAQYYRAAALEKLKRTEEAIEALKAALPGSEHERPVLWSWRFPTTNKHGLIRALDTAQVQMQRLFFHAEHKPTLLERQAIYAEATDKGTALYFVDAARHDVHRQEIPGEVNISFAKPDETAYGNGTLTVLQSVSASVDSRATRTTLYAFSSNGDRLWDITLPEGAKDPLLAGFIRDAFYVEMPDLHRVDLLDARTGNLRWSNRGVQNDGLEVPPVAVTRTHGEILIFRSQDTYRAVRMKDGKDAWVVRGIAADKVSQLVTDRLLIILEADRRILCVDLETGKPAQEVKLEQFADRMRTRFGPIWLVGAMVYGNTLYVLSKDMQLYAISIAPHSGRLLWHTPMSSRVQAIRVTRNHIYIGSASGDLIVLNLSGKILTTAHVSSTDVTIEYASDDIVILESERKLHGVTPLGAKIWEYPILFGLDTTYLNGVVTTYKSPSEIVALDAATGKVLWQYSGTVVPWVYRTADRLFVLGRDGVDEYSTGKRPDAVADRQILTALARLYLNKRDLPQAETFASKAADIDPDYPELALVRARLYQAQKKPELAGLELARYSTLVGFDSKMGQQAIGELHNEYRLTWQSTVDADVAGDPIVVEDRLVSIGRRTGDHLHIDALNAETGAMLWRYEAERFVASVLGMYENRPVLWVAAGDAKNTAAAVLYRIDIRTGQRKTIASWQRTVRIEQAWAAFAAGRVFVVTASPDPAAKTLEVDIDCFDAGSGAGVWHKTHKLQKATAQELSHPVALVTIQNDKFTYSAGSQAFSVRASDGAVLPLPSPAVDSGRSWRIANDNVAEEVDPKTGRVIAKTVTLWRPSTFRFQNGRMYAFTADGHAYAMSLTMSEAATAAKFR